MKPTPARIPVAVALALTLCVASPSRGDDELCEDDRGDAGSLPGTARLATGTGPLRLITGALASAFADARQAIPDLEDLYLVQIFDPTAFLAQTIVPPEPPLFDTSLFLFDPCGLGNLGNKEKPGMAGSPFALLGPMATDATGFHLKAAGPYYIGISGAAREPGNQFGPLFQFAMPGEISGPDGAGADFPLANWLKESAQGNYRVMLEGVTYLGRQPLCAPDLDGDGTVGSPDLGLLLSAWGPCQPGQCAADLDGSGVVGSADLGVLLSAWGGCPLVGTPCGDPAAGSCFAADGTPGCENPCCCTQVCLVQPGCCQVAWDDQCVAAAELVCP